jgi:hypothetical protein
VANCGKIYYLEQQASSHAVPASGATKDGVGYLSFFDPIDFECDTLCFVDELQEVFRVWF